VTRPIALARPALALEDLQGVHAVLASGQLVQAAQVAAFEEALSRVLDGAAVVAVSSGTAALHVALLALDAPPGAEVVVPAFTFPSVANVVWLCGLTPRLVDVSLDDYGPAAAEVLAAIGPQTAAVIWVHQLGNVPADDRVLAEIAARVPLLEDAACSLGARIGGRASGTLGRMGCTSFHPRKIVTTGEGGAIFTHDAELAARLRSLRNHGQAEGEAGFLRFERPGLNARLGELNAAIGRSQLASLGYFLEKRRRLGRRYVERLAGVPGVTVPAAYREGRTNFQGLAVLLDPALDRDALITTLRGRGIETTIGGYSIPHQPAYVRRFGPPGDRFPNAERAFRHALALPLHPGLDDADVDAVVAALADGMAHQGEVKA
jgi:dTDP-4-amino-4,6-dideoxygalactose transaminase